MRWGKARTCHESGLWSFTRSPHWRLHHTTATRHPRTAFPINHCTKHTTVTNHSLHWLHSWIPSDTLYKPWTSSLSHRRVLFCYGRYLWAFPLCECPVDYLDCFILIYRLLPAFWIFSLSAAAAPTFALSLVMYQPCFVNLVTVDWTCLLTSSCLIKLHLISTSTDPSL